MLLKINRRKVDFLIGGAQKAGTTALDYYMRQHPEIGMGQTKELHFFDNEEIFSKRPIDYTEYEKLFDFAAGKKMVGEATPIYLYWEPSCRRIWEYNPRIKLIFILRNPIYRAFSHWNMEYDRKAERRDFSYAIRNETIRVREALPLQHRVYSYIDRGYYSEQIRRVRRFFSADQTMFIKYEEFNENQETVLKDVFKFLGVGTNAYVYAHHPIHKRKKHAVMSAEDKAYLLERFKHEILQVETMLKWDCSDWLK